MEGETRQSERAETVTVEEKEKFISAMRGHPLLATILPPSYRYHVSKGRPAAGQLVQSGHWTNNGQPVSRTEMEQYVEAGIARLFGFWPQRHEIRGVLDAINDSHRHSEIYRFMHRNFAPRHGQSLPTEELWDRWKGWEQRLRIPERTLWAMMQELGFVVERGAVRGWCRLDTAPTPPSKPVQAAKLKAAPRAKPVNDGRSAEERLLERMEQLGIPADVSWAQRYKLYRAALKKQTALT